ncbi:alpha/beta hydrolase family protein [Pseudoalteromonas piratica]|uniref:Peptidase S9 n=1 Tax=Pseudoalteromonas piratica TaxID=1348114 RepID=A0A0A7EJZ1_9GAMM|nr:S9 family peptidase [Pseudoalteromonas piratica]AIY66990.1 peptidase S9 [Pseudoalteromonas piratica]
MLNRLLAVLLFLFVLNIKAEPLPIKSFASLPQVQNVNLSPDGNKIAYLQNYAGTLVLRVFDNTAQKDLPVIKSDNLNTILNWVEWANNDVLLLGLSYTSREGSLKYTSTRLYKFDLKSKTQKPVRLISPKRGRETLDPQFQDNVINFLPEDDEHILVAAAFDTPNRPSVYKVNVNTRKRKRLMRSKDNVKDWITDRQGNVRIGFAVDDTTVTYKLFVKNSHKQKELFKFEVFSRDRVSIIGFDKNPNIIYFTALLDGKDALYKTDISKDILKHELVFSDPDYDFDGSLLYSNVTGEVIGFTHSNLDNGRQYWDTDRANLQKALNSAFPEDKITVFDFSDDGTKYLAYKRSTMDPGTYYFGDRAANNISIFSQRYPDITEQVIAQKTNIVYPARDGLNIEGYLTLPNSENTQNLPTIILPHGGPMARDYAGFDYWSQLFANQGYAVLQPNFRGSSGYGYDFEMSALQGWGDEMQNDLEDAAKWMISKGYADKDRICMVGASYGGYASLMALIKHPETFKCAASFAPVTDLEMIVSKARYFDNKEIIKAQFGTDDDKLASQSPVNFAKVINRPILLIHGTDDKVVPVAHSRDMFDELNDYDKQVEYIELEDGNHYLNYEKHRIQTLTAITEFLKKHL